MNRRLFIQKVSVLSGVLIMSNWSKRVVAHTKQESLCILCTGNKQNPNNFTPRVVPEHSKISSWQARADLIQQIKQEQKSVLLLDSGDFFHSGIMYDLSKGAYDVEAMNLMGYNAVGLGKQEFVGGIDNLAQQLIKAQFTVLCCNYIITHNTLSTIIKPYLIHHFGEFKVGITAVGIDLNRDEPSKIKSGVKYLDPIIEAEKMAKILKKKMNCDMVICLSDLGLGSFEDVLVNDLHLAKKTKHIDLIIGGHSQHLLQKPYKVFNGQKREVLIVQSGYEDTHLGRLDFIFSKEKKILSSNAQTVEIGK